MNTQHKPLNSPGLPIWRQQLQALRQQAQAWWNERSTQERKLLRLGTIVVIAALVWVIGLRPALHTIEQTKEQLPRLRADAAKVDALILETQALQRGRTGKINTADLSQALQTTLQRAGLEASYTFSEITGTNTDSVRQWEITLDNARAALVMEWLASLPYLLQVQAQSIQLTRTNIDGRDRPGHINGQITVQQSQQNNP